MTEWSHAEAPTTIIGDLVVNGTADAAPSAPAPKACSYFTDGHHYPSGWPGRRDFPDAVVLTCNCGQKLTYAQTPAPAPDTTALVEFVSGLAEDACCETPGCSVDDPKCTAMGARAALAAHDRAGEAGR